MITKLIKIVKKFKRRGRGYSSGKGGHTVGRGQKGQKSRGKGKPGVLHEGGRVPIHRKIPKTRGRGFKPVKEYTSINIDSLLELLNKSNKKYKVINPKVLQRLGFKKSKNGYKIFGKPGKKINLVFRGVKISKSLASQQNS